MWFLGGCTAGYCPEWLVWGAGGRLPRLHGRATPDPTLSLTDDYTWVFLCWEIVSKAKDLPFTYPLTMTFPILSYLKVVRALLSLQARKPHWLNGIPPRVECAFKPAPVLAHLFRLHLKPKTSFLQQTCNGSIHLEDRRPLSSFKLSSYSFPTILSLNLLSFLAFSCILNHMAILLTASMAPKRRDRLVIFFPIWLVPGPPLVVTLENLISWPFIFNRVSHKSNS